MSERLTNEELLASAIAGDNSAFAVFCTRVLPDIRSDVRTYCRRFGVSDEFIDDLCNEVAVKLLEYVKKHRDHANPVRNSRAWLRAIARHAVIDGARSRGKLPVRLSLDVADERTGLDELVELNDLFEVLTKREREVLWLLYRERNSVKDVALILGISEGAVRKAHQRALERLREMLQN